MRKSCNIILYEGDHWVDADEGNSISEKIRAAVGDISCEQLDSIFEYMVENGLMIVNGKSEKTRLRFVGSFTMEFKNLFIAFYCFPKYLKQHSTTNADTDIIGEMFGILNVISATDHIYDYLDTTEFAENKYNSAYSNVASYKLAKWLIEDYAINGIFSIKERRISNHRGKIDWTRTIYKRTPLLDGEDIIYANTVKNHIKYNDKVLLSDIHRVAMAEVIEYLKKCGETVRVKEPDAEECMKGKLATYVGIVKKYQRLVYAERDIKLLRALEAWCIHESKYYEKPIGTVSFELVWEDALRMVFGNIPKDFSFGSPEYRLGVDKEGNPNKQMVNNDSIPDIINVFKDENNDVKFLLLDAKYYTGFIGDNKVNGKGKLKEGYQWIVGFPGYKDIAKQFDYYQTLIEEYGLSEGINVFVMPWYDVKGIEILPKPPLDWVRYLGYAYKGEIDEEDSVRKKMQELGVWSDNTNEASSNGKRVLVIQIKPSWLYNEVAKNNNDTSENTKILWDFLSDVVQ